jgi:hypothetical protein
MSSRRLVVWPLIVALVAGSESDAQTQNQRRRQSNQGTSKPTAVQLSKPLTEDSESPVPEDIAPLELAKEEAVRGGFLPAWFRLIRIDGSTEGGQTYNSRQPGDSRPLEKPDGFDEYPDRQTRIIRIPGRPATPPTPLPPSGCQIPGAPESECGEGFGEFRPPQPPGEIPGDPGTPDQFIEVEEKGRKRDWKDIKDGRVRHGENPLRVFDRRHNAGMVNAVRIRVTKESTEESPMGFSFRFLGGSDAEVANGSEENTLDKVAAQEAMGMFRLPGTKATKVFAGRMPSAVGAEVIEARDNYNQSRGLLFALIQPLTVEGGRVEHPLTEKVTVSGGVLNGWDQSVQGEDSGGTGEAKVTYKPSDKTTLTGAMMSGQGSSTKGGGQRTLVDLVAKHTFSETAEGYVNANFITEGAGEASGISAGYRKRFSNRMTVACRLEVIDDPDGARTGMSQTLGSATVTGDYRLGKRTIGRVELRHDTSTASSFVDDRRPVSNQNTISANILYGF